MRVGDDDIDDSVELLPDELPGQRRRGLLDEEIQADLNQDGSEDASSIEPVSSFEEEEEVKKGDEIQSVLEESVEEIPILIQDDT